MALGDDDGRRNQVAPDNHNCIRDHNFFGGILRIGKVRAACDDDIKKYCSTVTPGDSRLMLCIQLTKI